MKNVRVEKASKIPESREKFMKTVANKDIIELSHVYIDLSEELLNKIDLFYSNTNLNKNQQRQLMKIFEEIYSEAYVEASFD